MDLFEEFGEEVVCKICNQADGLEKDQIHETNDVQAHFFCLLFSSGLGQKGKEDEGIKGFLAADIRKELKRGARLKCVYCRKKGATVGCAEQKCKKSYHLPCGNQHDSLQQYFDQFKSYCKDHRPAQKVARSGGKKSEKKDNLCIICQDKITRKATVKTLWAPCCEEFFHRSCIQDLAHSYGSYNFRCPLCKNDDKFVLEMKTLGIYVPMQDASWENGQAYQDIDEPPVRLCHAKICFCPQEGGRAYNKEHGLWEVLPCRSCGSRGIHAKCGGLEDFPDAQWDCYNCRKVTNDDKPKQNPHTEKLWSFLKDEQRNSCEEDASTSEHRPNPNRLFEALLATLPHLQSMEENLAKEECGSDKLQLTITPVVNNKQSSPDLPVHPPVVSSSTAVRHGPSAILDTASVHPNTSFQLAPNHVQSATNPSPVTIQVASNSTPVLRQMSSKKLTTNSSTQLVFPSNPSSAHLQLVSNGVPPSPVSNNRSHSSPYQTSSTTVSNPSRTTNFPRPGPLQTASNVSTSSVNGSQPVPVTIADPGPSGLHHASRKILGGAREQQPVVRVENGGRKVVTKRIPSVGKPVKELYDYSLEDVIRSRLKENSGDEHDGSSLKLPKGSCGTSLKDKGGLGQYGIQKTPPVLRLVSGDPSSQRKMTEYFLNRKH